MRVAKSFRRAIIASVRYRPKGDIVLAGQAVPRGKYDSVANSIFEGKNGEYLFVSLMKISSFYCDFLTWDGMQTRMVFPDFAICDRTCATSTVLLLQEGGAQLAKRWREALQRRPAGGGVKRPQAAWVESPGSER